MKKTAQQLATQILSMYHLQKTAQEIAMDVLSKSAAIYDEDIAAGLAGTPTRNDITEEEVQDLMQQSGDAAYEKHKKAPLHGGIGMGAFGGITGAIAGSTMGRGRALPLGLLGAGVGGGLGALMGRGLRSSAVSNAQNMGLTVGQIAQTGRIPYAFPQGIGVEDLPPYATGIQGTPSTIDPNKENEIRERLANRLMVLRGTEGAIRGGTVGALRPYEGEDRTKEMLIGAAVHGGAETMRGRNEAKRLAQEILDLKSRGYGTLADRYYNAAMNPETMGY
jgi:hypothetical protein